MVSTDFGNHMVKTARNIGYLIRFDIIRIDVNLVFILSRGGLKTSGLLGWIEPLRVVKRVILMFTFTWSANVLHPILK